MPDFPELIALWWPRFEKIARWFVATEADSRADVVERIVEGNGEMAVTPDFTLSARADRLDVPRDGTLAIIDYKTGTPPRREGGAFAFAAASARGADRARRRLRRVSAAASPSGSNTTGSPAAAKGRARRPQRAERTATLAARRSPRPRSGLRALVAYFAKPDADYLSRKMPKRGRVFVGDYDHLARVAEWIDDRGGRRPGDRPA